MRVPAAFLLLFAAALSAQQAAPPAEPHGTVVVHVACADTNRPARLAGVTLQPVDLIIPDPYNFAKASKPGQPTPKATVLTTVRTGLDGSVTLPDVAPGRYYVVVEYSGYLSPSAQFSREEMNKPDGETKALIEKTIPVVAVAAHQSSSVDVRLIHAAVVTGTIRYDDGSPAPDTTVELRRRGRSGEFFPALPRENFKTDDEGRYRISGLAPGEYRFEARLQLSTTSGGNVFGYSGFAYTHYTAAPEFYSGDTMRAADAKTFKLTEGETSNGNDITIPVSRLHSVSGTLVDARSGVALNHGYLSLYSGDDKDPIAHGMIDPDLRTFYIPLVLEGEYRVKVSSASELNRELLPPVGDSPIYRPPQYKERAVQQYDELNVPLLVHNDVTGLALALTPSAPKPPAAKSK